MEGGRRDREVSTLRKWKDGGMEIGVSGGERLVGDAGYGERWKDWEEDKIEERCLFLS